MKRNKENQMSFDEINISKEAAAARTALAFADAVLKTPPTKNFHHTSISLSESNKFGRISRPSSNNRPRWRYGSQSDSKHLSTPLSRVRRTYRKPPVPLTSSKARHPSTSSIANQFQTPQNTKYFNTGMRLSHKFNDQTNQVHMGCCRSRNEILEVQTDQQTDKYSVGCRASQELVCSNAVVVQSFSLAHQKLLEKLAKDTKVLISEATEFTTRATTSTLSSAVDSFQNAGYQDHDNGDEVVLSSSYSAIRQTLNLQNHRMAVKELFSQGDDDENEKRSSESEDLTIDGDHKDNPEIGKNDINTTKEAEEDINNNKEDEGENDNFGKEELMEATAVLALARAREVLKRSVSVSPEPAWYTSFKEQKQSGSSNQHESPLSIASTPPPAPPCLSPSPHFTSRPVSSTLSSKCYHQTQNDDAGQAPAISSPPRSAFTPVRLNSEVASGKSSRRQWFEQVALAQQPLAISHNQADPAEAETLEIVKRQPAVHHNNSEGFEEILTKLGDMKNEVHSSLTDRIGRNLSQDEVEAIMKTAQLFSNNASGGTHKDTTDNTSGTHSDVDTDETIVSSFDPVKSKLGELEKTILGMSKGQTSSELESGAAIYDNEKRIGDHTKSDDGTTKLVGDYHRLSAPTSFTPDNKEPMIISFTSTIGSVEDEVVEDAVEAVVRAAQRVSKIETESSLHLTQTIGSMIADETNKSKINDDDDDDEVILRNAIKEKNWLIHAESLKSYTVYQARSLTNVIKQWHSWSYHRKVTAISVAQCRGRILRKRRRGAIRRWYLWTQSNQKQNVLNSAASEHYRKRMLQGSPLLQSKLPYRSMVIHQWHRYTQDKTNRKKLVDDYLRRKHLRNWKKRIVNKTEAKLAEWRGSLRFEQRSLSCAMTKWRKHRFDNKNAKTTLILFSACVQFPKSGLVAKCFRIWHILSITRKESLLSLRNKCFEALWDHVVTCATARKLIRSRWLKRIRSKKSEVRENISTSMYDTSIAVNEETTNAVMRAQFSPTTPVESLKPSSSTPVTRGQSLKPSSSTPATRGESLKPSSSTPITRGESLKPSSSTPVTRGESLKLSSSTSATRVESLKPSSSTPVTRGESLKPSSSTPATRGESLKPSSSTSTTRVESLKPRVAKYVEIASLATYHQRSALRKWREVVVKRKQQELSSSLMQAATNYYTRNLLRLVLVSWNTWPALAERRAVKFWKATHIRRLLWRWFSFAFDPTVREIRLIRMLRSSKGYSSSSWKDEHTNVHSSFSSSTSYEPHHYYELLPHNNNEEGGINHPYDSFQYHSRSRHESSTLQPQPRPSAALRGPTPKPSLGKKNSSYAELHNVMTEIKTLNKNEPRKLGVFHSEHA